MNYEAKTAIERAVKMSSEGRFDSTISYVMNDSVGMAIYANTCDRVIAGLTKNEVKHTCEALHDGYAIRFPWKEGADVAVHFGSYGSACGYVESIGWPWDDGDVSMLSPDDAVNKITDEYRKTVGELYFVQKEYGYGAHVPINTYGWKRTGSSAHPFSWNYDSSCIAGSIPALSMLDAVNQIDNWDKENVKAYAMLMPVDPEKEPIVWQPGNATLPAFLRMELNPKMVYAVVFAENVESAKYQVRQEIEGCGWKFEFADSISQMTNVTPIKDIFDENTFIESNVAGVMITVSVFGIGYDEALERAKIKASQAIDELSKKNESAKEAGYEFAKDILNK